MKEKLIRDKIPDRIMKNGGTVNIRIESDEQRRKEFLKEKFEEEIREFRENPSLEEMADVVEAMLSMLDVSMNDLENRVICKRQNNGRFEKFYIMRLEEDND